MVQIKEVPELQLCRRQSDFFGKYAGPVVCRSAVKSHLVIKTSGKRTFRCNLLRDGSVLLFNALCAPGGASELCAGCRKRKEKAESVGWRGCRLIDSLPVAIAVEETVCPVAAAQIGAFGEALAADLHRVWAAGMEAAAGGRGNQARNFAARSYLSHPTAASLDAVGIGRG